MTENTCPAGKELCRLHARYLNIPNEFCPAHPGMRFPDVDSHHVKDGTPCGEGCEIEAQANRGYNRLTHGVDSPHHITRSPQKKQEDELIMFAPVCPKDKTPLMGSPDGDGYCDKCSYQGMGVDSESIHAYCCRCSVCKAQEKPGLVGIDEVDRIREQRQNFFVGGPKENTREYSEGIFRLAFHEMAILFHIIRDLKEENKAKEETNN